ncbi:MAG: aminotransferase class V-fold PLP-dependent enzyme [Alphaproteobacteria bacterium]|jgi:isopenicillin-N epimerase|nr:aminotransferase class V-fold PLP-dependent enzyme [Alphaproteobacteria bacterium]MDP6831967.1 aminotransferase class V-fold PLP-dependent enzyme [Alphaproteobacteria bacterium]
MTAAFGHELRGHWPLEDGAIYLNHGTVGVTPNQVLAAQWEIKQRIEAHPARFMLRDLKPGLRAAADRVAGHLGGRGEDYIFTDNATTGINAVLRSAHLRPGDEVLVTDHTYGAVANAARYACEQAGASLVTVLIPFPIADEAAALAAIESGLSDHTRIAILDHITSETGIVLPLAELVDLCHDAGAQVLVDGAHAPGTIGLDIPGLGAEWYAANLHKWLFAPRGCGVLWAREDVQPELHPAVISWRLGEGYTAEFDWTGTRDPSPFLCLPAALEFLDGLGAEAVCSYNHELAVGAAAMMADRFEGTMGAPAAMASAMALAPLPENLPAEAVEADALRDHLLYEHNIEVPIVVRAGRLWARLAAQVYCQMTDFEVLAGAVQEWTATR